MNCFIKIKNIRQIVILIISIAVYSSVSAQDYPKGGFTAPLKGNLSLSGDFGELRSNHFHMGIDLRLRTGTPLYAVADGYVSRLKTEAGGYGNAVYIDHPNGFRSVYAHLDRFTPEMSKHMKYKQLQTTSFSVTDYPDKSSFPVKQGDIIGYGGNSGYSFGSHLHFEIRHAKNDVAVNPYHLFAIDNDYRAPQAYHIQLSPQNSESSVEGQNSSAVYSLQQKGNNYYPKERLRVSGTVGISVQAIDRKPGERNSYSLYRAEVYKDDEKIFAFKKDEISYYETRYLNSFIDYGLYSRKRLRYTNLFKEKGSRLQLYSDLTNAGYITIKANEKPLIKIKLYDFAGNMSEIIFKLHGENYTGTPQTECDIQMKANEKNYFVRDDFRLISGETTFYNDFCFEYSKISSNEHLFSDWHIVHKSDEPVHENLQIAIRTDLKNYDIIEKLCLVRLGSKGQFIYIGGEYLNGFVTGDIRRFGQYAVYADTIPPTLIPNNFSENSSVCQMSILTFKAEDNLSGIAGYKATLNKQKLIAEYDLKNHIITVYLPTMSQENKECDFSLAVFDNKGNKTVFTSPLL